MLTSLLIGVLPALAVADMPDVSLTPGAVADTDPRVVCAYGYASARRHVSYAERDAVYREYGIPRGTRSTSPRRGYRIDHLVPLELGGANSVGNLWPQHLADSKRKDRVEERLHAAVCVEHALTLGAAQTAIAHDWMRTPVGLPSR
ncbi:MAG: HNH endonuclease [Vulcanimicrobiaceae bacterium]